jgi:SAM-dependent methyltransferase
MVQGRAPLRILDVGCGPGWLAKALTDAGHSVVGVDIAEADGVSGRMSRFLAADLSNGIPDSVGGDFDLVLAADVIEHLADPSRLLADMAARVQPHGSIIASVPNISHWYPRARIAAGRFDYDQRGVLDGTHLRFFTRRRFLRVAQEAGLEPVSWRHTGLPLDALGLSGSKLVTATIGRADRALVSAWPTMFAYQFVYELTPWRGGALRSDAPR